MLYVRGGYGNNAHGCCFSLIGPEQKRVPWWDPWILIWYPLISFFRMAGLLSATTFIYFTIGTILYNSLTKIGFSASDEKFQRMVWLTSIFTAIAAYPLFSAATVTFGGIILSLTSVKMIIVTHVHVPIEFYNVGYLISSYHSHYLILSGYMLYSWTVFQFSNPTSKDTIIHISKYSDIVNNTTAPP